MAPRAGSGKTAVDFAARAAALACLLALGSGWSSADPRIPLGGEGTRQIDLLKPPNEDLKIRWSANVHEEGGEFLISRQGLGGSTLEVARVRARGDGRYEVAEHGPTGSWIYKLRYRNSRGREQVLITIRLNVERLDPGRPIANSGGDGPPVAVRMAAVLPLPAAATWSFPASTGTAASGPDYGPPTPPP